MSGVTSAIEYTAPPVIEAIVQVIYGDGIDASRNGKLVRRVSREYANSQFTEEVKVRLDFAKRGAFFDGTPQARLSSGDEADVLIIQQQALTWTRLAPYEGWDALLQRVSRDAVLANDLLGYRKVERIGIRYINRIDVPPSGSFVRYEDYLAINIDLPPQWEAVDSYGWRFERPFDEFKAIVQSATVQQVVPNTAAFILDIDVILDKAIPPKLDDMLEKMHQMRVIKNTIFETCISAQARASFK